MNTAQIIAALESVLFVHGDPLSKKDLLQILQKHHDSEFSVHDFRELFVQWKAKYESEDYGIRLIEMGDMLQLMTKAEYAPYVEEITQKKKTTSLSQAALEVLSIVAYKQPVTRLEVDEIRGVKSDAAIAKLLESDLIKQAGRLDKIGRPMLYGTTEQFLIHFGFTSLKDLPEVNFSTDPTEPVQQKENVSE